MSDDSNVHQGLPDGAGGTVDVESSARPGGGPGAGGFGRDGGRGGRDGGRGGRDGGRGNKRDRRQVRRGEWCVSGVLCCCGCCLEIMTQAIPVHDQPITNTRGGSLSAFRPSARLSTLLRCGLSLIVLFDASWRAGAGGGARVRRG